MRPGIYVWNASGQMRSGFPVFPPHLQYLPQARQISIVGIGNVMPNPGKEIVVTAGRDQTIGGGILVISAAGQILAHLDPSKILRTDHAPILADLNGDRYDEIIALEGPAWWN